MDLNDLESGYFARVQSDNYVTISVFGIWLCCLETKR